MASQMLFFIVLSLAILSCSWGYQQEENIVFYMHDIVSKPNATAIVVAGVNGISSELLNIGTVLVIDDLLTEEPDHSSTVVGRAKGIYEFSDVKGNAVHMVFSVVFENKKYNGSTLEIHGTDIFTRSSGSEVSVVGGTGKLRYARGYSNVTLHSAVGFDGILKFNTFFRLD
ncbi:hypothetical protein SUGI_0647370 [Cryptomeria japonica]|uniref:dirigent protein 2-like n=1 Tax=Cryptomeria japonica TaxID=3369 RepID=UPI002414BD22|nr:dirigent protein 2-like [Cryptomeria japonica]GLJ32154.1 hypothetical protein SUGI_0647370 [Cryptomeria japonica]